MFYFTQSKFFSLYVRHAGWQIAIVIHIWDLPDIGSLLMHTLKITVAQEKHSELNLTESGVSSFVLYN